MASSGGDMVHVPEGYPVGTRVLAVDADTIALTTLKQMLQRCGYLVTAKTSAEEALREVRDNPEGFDLVMSELNTRGRMDGFGLLRRLHDRLPVIIFSTGDAVLTVRRVVEDGACSYLQKPLRMEEIRNIWQHVVRRGGIRAPPPRGADAPGRQDHGDKEKTTTTTTRKRGADDCEEDHHGRGKKPKFQWSPVLHALFIGAVNQLKGKDEITPKRIKELLGREGEHVTQDQVASHLQKYRKDCQNAQLSANASSSHANVYKNYVTPQDIEESFTYFKRSQGGKIDHDSIIRQTSLKLTDDALSVGYGVLGNGSCTASHGGFLANDESLVSAVVRAVKGTTTGHGGVHTNQNLVTASLPSNLAQPQQPMSSGFPTNFISTYDPNLAQPQQPMSSNFPTNFISTYDPNLAQPQQPMNSGFPANFIFPVTHEGLSAQQTSQLCYVDDGSMLPWSELGGVDDDPLMSSLLGGDEAVRGGRTLDMSQVMLDFGTTGEIRALQPEGPHSGFFSVESTNGTTSTSGGGGVLTDGTMADQFEDELENFINPNMQ